MILIAEPYFRFEKTLNIERLELAATALLKHAEESVALCYGPERMRSLDVTVYIELGSTKVWVAVLTAANIFTSYGSIRQSIDYLIKDAQTVAEIIVPAISNVIGLGAKQPDVIQRRLGVPGQLKHLFESVERNEISAAEASRQVAKIFNADPDFPNAEYGEFFIQQIKHELRAVQRSGVATAFTSREDIPLPKRLPMPALPPVEFVASTGDKRPRRGLVAKRDQNGKIHFTPY